MLHETTDNMNLLLFIIVQLVLVPIFWHRGMKNRNVIDEDSKKRFSGEKVERKTKLFLESNFKFPALQGVIFKTDYGMTSESDIIQVNKKGIFVVECKYRNGDISGSAKSDVWEVYERDGTKTMPNTVRQNFYHIKAMSNYLKEQNVEIEDIPVYNISVIFGEGKREQAKDINNSKIKVYSGWGELNELKKLPDTLDVNIIKRIHKLLSHNVANEEEKKRHKELINEKYN